MKLILIISLILSGITQYSPQVIAQTKQPSDNKKPAQPTRRNTSRRKPASTRRSTSRPVFVPPRTPNGLTSISGRRAGMGSRGNCPTVTNPLTALVPFQEENNLRKNTTKSFIGRVKGLTTSEKPRFLFYVPYTQNLENSNAEFSLQDSEGTDVYRKEISLPQQPGVISISLPNTVESLKPERSYRWYFKVRCKQERGNLPIYVEGDIQRISLNSRLKQELKAAVEPRQKIAVYAKEGIWFDALNMLAQIRQSPVQDASLKASLKEDWQSLLDSVDLNNIATAPLLNSGQIK